LRNHVSPPNAKSVELPVKIITTWAIQGHAKNGRLI
jgi:hypothetical protein